MLQAQLDRASDEAPEQLLSVGDRLIEIQHLRPEHLLPAEGQQLPGEVGHPLHGLLDFLKVLA